MSKRKMPPVDALPVAKTPEEHRQISRDVREILSGKNRKVMEEGVPGRVDRTMNVEMPARMPGWRWRRDRSRARRCRDLPKARKMFKIPKSKVLGYTEFLNLLDRFYKATGKDRYGRPV